MDWSGLDKDVWLHPTQLFGLENFQPKWLGSRNGSNPTQIFDICESKNGMGFKKQEANIALQML